MISGQSTAQVRLHALQPVVFGRRSPLRSLIIIIITVVVILILIMLMLIIV